MTLSLYAHPFSSYSQKAFIAFYESKTPFELKALAPESPHHFDEFKKLWPIGKFPVLDDNGTVVFEASSIIEYLTARYPAAAPLIPEDRSVALDVRMMDRVFDNYVMTPTGAIVQDALLPPDKKNAHAITQARSMLDVIYRWLDQRMTGREWAAGKAFSLADCAAAPALFYADWAHPIGWEFRELRAYRNRLLARPSFARAVDGGRPYRHFFPLSAPDRD